MASPLAQFTRQEDRGTTDVFVVCPNSRIRMDLNDRLAMPRWNVIQTGTGAGALEMLQKHGADDGILLLDPNLTDLDLNEFLDIVKLRYPNVQLMTLNSHTGQLLIGGSSPTALSTRLAELINYGVAAVPKPASDNDGKSLRHVYDDGLNLRGMIGDSEPMKRTYHLTRMVAARDTTVLVTGESGTGKELIAQEIHLISPRRKQPFVAVNCSAIPDALLEAELFGYVKGAFTGAVQSRIGRIHAAHGGTLFLDEVGDMPLSLQSKILRFLEQGEVQRLGGLDNLKVDVRVVAATNADLKKLISKQLFREDLYYRLAIFPIQLPPLRERMGDLEELAEFFVAKYSRGTALTREALRMLQQHNWPGNVRELRNVIERASVLVGMEHEIKPEHIFL